MHNLNRKVSCWLLAAFLAFCLPLSVQAEGQNFSSDELEQILAPIALYPDSLLGNVLVASTYPNQVIEANRWLQSNPGRSLDQVSKAADNTDWDKSIQSLLLTPDVLSMMADDMTWTGWLCDAFINQTGDVYDKVQTLRKIAFERGTLSSNDKVRVIKDESESIVITSVQPEVVVVPAYRSSYVYGWDAGDVIAASAISWATYTILDNIYYGSCWDWRNRHFWWGPGYNYYGYYDGGFRPWYNGHHAPPPPPPHHPPYNPPPRPGHHGHHGHEPVYYTSVHGGTNNLAPTGGSYRPDRPGSGIGRPTIGGPRSAFVSGPTNSGGRTLRRPSDINNSGSRTSHGQRQSSIGDRGSIARPGSNDLGSSLTRPGSRSSDRGSIARPGSNSTSSFTRPSSTSSGRGSLSRPSSNSTSSFTRPSSTGYDRGSVSRPSSTSINSLSRPSITSSGRGSLSRPSSSRPTSNVSGSSNTGFTRSSVGNYSSGGRSSYSSPSSGGHSSYSSPSSGGRSSYSSPSSGGRSSYSSPSSGGRSSYSSPSSGERSSYSSPSSGGRSSYSNPSSGRGSSSGGRRSR